MRIGLRVSTRFDDILEKSSPEKAEKLEYFRKKILDHISKLEQAEMAAMNKAFADEERLTKGGFPVGTIRTWNGVKHIKGGDGKWRPKYDDHTRGAKMSLAFLRKKIAAAKDEHEMLQLCLLNRDRFSDKNGNPLPFMRELHNYIEEQKTVKAKATAPRINEARLKEIQADFESGKMGYDEAKKLVHEEGGIPKTAHPRWLKSDETKKREAAIIERKNNDRAFVKTLPKNQQYRAERWIAEKEYKFSRGVKSVSEFVNEQFKAGKLTLDPAPVEDGGGVNGYNIGKYGRLYAEYLLKKDGNTAPSEENKQKAKIETEKLLKRMERNEEERKRGIYHPLGHEWAKEVSETMRRSPEESERIAANAKRLLEGDDSPAAKELYRVLFGNDKDAGKSPDDLFQEIQKKYQSANAVEGDDDEVQVGKESLPGKWKLVEADTPTASHNETTFQKTPGFPTNADGTSINDRDYEHFQANKEAVLNIASDFDGRALKFDSPIVVTTDGIVISGNNRTMSSKIAAKKGTDTKYIEALKKRAKKFGFTDEQVGQFKNPRIVFEVEQKGGYSTQQFAKFNESGKKEQGPTEKAAKISKMIKPEIIEAVAKKIDEFDTLGDLYRDLNASRQIYTLFKDAGLIGENEAGRYFENSVLTDDGKTFIETALLGTVINENNLRGFNRPGCKSIRATLMRALIPLVENKGMTGYSINKELNEAVDIAMQVAINKDQFNSVDEFARQQSMFEKFDPVSVELAKKMEGTQKAFAEFMKGMNGGLRVAANGEADIFLGKVESKEDILNRFLPIKKAVIDVLNSIRGFFD